VSFILSAAAFVVIVVAIGVMSSMRIGVTSWVQVPTWLCVAMAAFFTMLSDHDPAWFEVAMIVSMSGMLWRYRHRLEWEVAHAPPDRAKLRETVQRLHRSLRSIIG
jgi:hypothetical protein